MACNLQRQFYEGQSHENRSPYETLFVHKMVPGKFYCETDWVGDSKTLVTTTANMKVISLLWLIHLLKYLMSVIIDHNYKL